MDIHEGDRREVRQLGHKCMVLNNSARLWQHIVLAFNRCKRWGWPGWGCDVVHNVVMHGLQVVNNILYTTDHRPERRIQQEIEY